MDAESLRLPRQIEDDPCFASLLAGLFANRRLLWEGGATRTPLAHLTPELTQSLELAQTAGRLTRGLEDAERALAAEEKGLRIADERVRKAGGSDRGQRVSRLLLLSDDGAERFYRHVESLLRRHEPRVLAVRLTASAEELGTAVVGPQTLVRLLLVTHKQAVTNALLALARQWAPEADSNLK